MKKNWLHSIQKVVIEEPEVEIVEKIKKARNKDKNVVRIVEEMKKTNIKELQEDRWRMEGDLVLKEKKIYMPKDRKLRVKIIQLYHDMLAAGHRGQWKTVELVTRNYW